jgi:Zn-dependent peptidase ImmA (M78 family)
VTIIATQQIYRTLSQVGLKKNHVRTLLPDWWDDSIASSETGAWEFVMLISRRLSIDAKSLASGSIVPIGSVSNIAYKHRSTVSDDYYRAGTMIAAALAESVTAAMHNDFTLTQFGPKFIRSSIQAQNNGVVDFDGLVTFCWNHGIPIIPLPNLPVGIRRIDGAVFKVNNRPAIIISRKNDSKAWLSFILAHEIGHYCLGHLQEGSSIIDVDLKREATFQSDTSSDQQEREADRFALSLLSGDEVEVTLRNWGQRITGVELAVNAKRDANSAGTSAGHLILRYAFLTSRWMEALTALKFLDEDFDAQNRLTQELSKRISLKNIAEDLRGLVVSITGIPDFD